MDFKTCILILDPILLPVPLLPPSALATCPAKQNLKVNSKNKGKKNRNKKQKTSNKINNHNLRVKVVV